MHSMLSATERERRNMRDPDKDEEEETETHSDEEENTKQESPQFRSSHSGYGGSYLQGHHSGHDDHHQRPSLNKSQEMQDALNVTAMMTLGNLPGASGSKQGLTSVPIDEEQQEHGITEDETAGLDKLTITPKESDAKNIQVRKL